jgi:hypothetical protein
MYQPGRAMLFSYVVTDVVKRGARMTSTEFVWSHDVARNALVAAIEDTNGREWTAGIQGDPNTPHPRLNTEVFCRAAGEWLSTRLPSSLEEAQAWCYPKLQLE